MTLAIAVRCCLLTLSTNIMGICLLDRKYSLKKTLIVFFTVSVLESAINLFIAETYGIKVFSTLYPLVSDLPTLITLYYLSERKGFFVLFNMSTVITCSSITIMPGNYLMQIKVLSIWAETLLRIFLTIPFILFLYHHLRPSYIKMYGIMKKGWGFLCLMPCSFFIINYLNVTPLTPEPPSYGKIMITCSLALTTVVVSYGIIFFLFRKTISDSEFQEEQRLLKAQIHAMERQADMLKEREEKISASRHDLRHYIAQLKTLIENGNTEEALRVLGSYDQRNMEITVPHYCDNPTINAILLYYIQKAEEENIRVETDCGTMQQLSVDASDLSIVLANAMENAIHACCKMPSDKERTITVKVVSSPQFALEVANTYEEEVKFDDNGIPISDETGHGLGTRSIAAFAEKYDGIIEYNAEDALFRIRLLAGV